MAAALCNMYNGKLYIIYELIEQNCDRTCPKIHTPRSWQLNLSAFLDASSGPIGLLSYSDVPHGSV